MNNIEPININSNDDIAKFEIKFNENEKDILKKYSYIHIILVDNKIEDNIIISFITKSLR